MQAAGTRDPSGFSAFETEFSFLQRNAPEEKASVGPWLLALFIFVVCGSGKCLGGRWALLVWNDVVNDQWVSPTRVVLYPPAESFTELFLVNQVTCTTNGGAPEISPTLICAQERFKKDRERDEIFLMIR